MQSWIEEELGSIDLGDERLDRRGKVLLERFATQPGASIPGACHGWDETQAAYRFFDNPKVDGQKVLLPHRQATLARMGREPVVLLVQDTTELDYTRPGEVVAGAGPLNWEERIGFFDHCQVAFTPQRLCLGVVDAEIWGRSFEEHGKGQERKHEPIEAKESFRWLEGYRVACQIAGEIPQTKLISVCDREADIYELFLEPTRQPRFCRAEWIVRARENRSLPERDPEAGPNAYHKLFDTMFQAPVLTQRVLRLPKTPKRAARQAVVEIRAQAMTLKPPYRRGEKLAEVTVYAILVREIDPPADAEPVFWLLLTSLPIDTLEQVLQVIEYYACRFQIEVFFRVLKTGCKVEELQLETQERLEPCLMLYKIVSWRVLYLTMLGRECPELPCDLIFAEEEWKSVWVISTQSPPPKQAPTLERFLAMLAALGGHLGRKHDGPPGPQTLWIGIRRMTDFALAWTAFGPERPTTYV
jgi:hypothetical protein